MLPKAPSLRHPEFSSGPPSIAHLPCGILSRRPPQVNKFRMTSIAFPSPLRETLSNKTRASMLCWSNSG